MSARPSPTGKYRHPSMPGMRLIVLALVLVVGLAGITWGLSSAFTAEAFVVVVIATGSTVPVALGVYVFSRKVEWATAFVLYADVGITSVLFAPRQYFDAMPGVVFLALVALFASVFTQKRILRAQTALSVSILAVLGILSALDGVEGLMVLSRFLTLLSICFVPIMVRMHVQFLHQQVETGRRDQVSGLLNRRGLDETIARSAPARGSSRVLGVILVHLDGFENIERRLGRSTSNELVAEVTQMLHETLPDAILGRPDKSEFACVVIGRPDDVDRDLTIMCARVEASRLRSATVSMKCTSATVGVDHRTAMHNALGRALASAALERYDIGESAPRGGYSHITDLVSDGGPSIVFQPILSVATGNVMGYEALSRFPAGHGSTQTWFLDAQAGGVQVQLELAAVHRAVQSSSGLADNAFLSINVSATTILATDLVPMLEPVSSARQVIIEITEHDLVSDYTELSSALDHLRAAGLSISVDDVGAGYSGLRQLVEIKPNVIKLDASIVRGIDTDDMRRAAATALTTFAAAIGAQCIYEGIETQKELDSARALGADMVQGFLVGRPQAIPRVDSRMIAP